MAPIAQLQAQDTSKSINYGYSSRALVGGGDASHLPFWFYANQDGKVDPGSANFINSIFVRYSDHTSALRYDTGMDITGRISKNGSLFLPVFYGEVGYGFLNLKAGRFYDPIGLNEHRLSMGSMLVSRNATPIPKIQLQTNGFVDVPLTQGYVQFKGMYSHGWFEKDRYVEHPYLHQKYLYLKLNYRFIEAVGGIVHNVMWGGKNAPNYGDLPSSFEDYIRVVTGMAAKETANTPGGEVVNVIGNSVAAYDFRLNLNFEKFQFHAYRLFYLEDKVSTRFRSPWDGMWGAGVRFSDNQKVVTAILWEHMNTKRQDSFDFEPRGTATYYNHFLYKSGWTYEGRVLGNPLLLNEPNPNFSNARAITNNIIVAHHIGIEGRPFNRLYYKAFFTYSRNYGLAEDQTQNGVRIPLSKLRKDEYSMLLKTEYLLSNELGLRMTNAIALDLGELYKNRIGFEIGFSWNGRQLLR